MPEWVALIKIFADGTDVAKVLLDEHFAVAYDGGKR